jgi:hypothetical protein
MHFLGRDEAHQLEKKLRREIASKLRPKLVLYYNSGNRDYAAAANVITASIGAFTEATMLFLYSISVDGGHEGMADGRWSRYRRWRDANGDTRRIYDAPGHRFKFHEVRQLSEALAFSLELGWDALLAARPGRQLMALSHDDRIEIHRGFERRLLADQLIALGYCHR